MLLRLIWMTLCALVVAAVAACGGGDGERPVDTPTPTPKVIPTARPDGQFTMCVQALRGAEQYQAEAMQRLGDALAEVQTDGRWPRYFPAGGEPVVDAGCPQEPAAPRSNFVEEPGYYRVHAFVVQQLPFNALFAQESVRTETGAGVEETAGMFVTPADLCDQGKLVQMLKTAVKFDHTLNPTPTPGAGETAPPSATPCF